MNFCKKRILVGGFQFLEEDQHRGLWNREAWLCNTGCRGVWMKDGRWICSWGRALWLETASTFISASAARIVRYMVPEAGDCRKSRNAFMFKVFECPPAFQSIFAMAFLSHDR